MQRPFLLSTLLLVLGARGASVGAQTLSSPQVPDAGRVLRDVQPAQGIKPFPPALKAHSDNPLDAGAVDQTLVSVSSIVIVGNREISTDELQALVSDLVGTRQSLGQLNAAARRITATYRERGYLVARAYLPAQDVTSGTVTIQVIEGRIGSYRISNRSLLSDERARAYLGQMQEGGVIHSAQLDRGLLLLQDTPGVRAARAALQPGSSVGTSDLLVELDPAQAYVANLAADNYGNRYTGEYRLDATAAWNSPLDLGDLLSLRAISSGPDMGYARLAWQLPLGADGLKLGAAYAETRYQLGAEFSALQSHGTARSNSLFLSYPLLRSQTANVSVTLTREDKQLVDQTDASFSRAQRLEQMLALGLAGNRQDALWGGGMSSFDISFSSGNLAMDAASLSLDAAPTSANSNGSFNKLTYSVNRQQLLSESYSLGLALSGQWASKNLGSAEKFSLGGANGVRAYPQGEGSGDQGWLINVDLRRTLGGPWQGLVFYDAGSVDTNRNPFGMGDNSRFIAGAGLALVGVVGPLQVNVAVAWPTSGGDARADTTKHLPRCWLQLNLPL